MNPLPKNSRVRFVLFCIVSLLFGCLLTATLSSQRVKEVNPNDAELFRDIRLLQDLDAGDLKSARQKLNDDGMYHVLFIMESVGFTTNKEVLYSQPGLRAAAKYWGNKRLPTDLVTFHMDDAGVSNRIYMTLQIVRAELDRSRQRTNEITK